MDCIESILKLSESDREKLLLLLRNVGTKVPCSDSAGESGIVSKDSLNLSNDVPEKPVPKQKTLDNWIVKTKSPQSISEKNVTHNKEIIPNAKTVGVPTNFESEEVSCTLVDDQLPCSSSTSSDKPCKVEKIHLYQKKLMVLLDKQDCLASINKSPENNVFSHNNEFSTENKLITPTAIKSSKHTHISENSRKKPLSPEKHSTTPPRSYNLRSAKGVSDENSTSETINSLNSPEDENIVKIDTMITQQKPKLKKSAGKDASPDSRACFNKINDDQKNDLHNNVFPKENSENCDIEILPTVVNSELEKATTVPEKSIHKNKTTATDKNPIPENSDSTLIVKGKRSRATKGKESKKLCLTNTAQKSSSIELNDAPIEINLNGKSAQSISTQKVAKLNSVNENSPESIISKTIQSHETDASTLNPKLPPTNDTVNSVSKLKLKKATKRKYKSDLILHETNFDLAETKVESKKLTNQESDSNIKYLDFQDGIPNKQLKSDTNSEHQSNRYAKERDELLVNDSLSGTTKNVDSKRVTRNTGSKRKIIKAAKGSFLSDSEMAAKIKDGDNNSSTVASKVSPQNKECAKETEELSTKDIHSEASIKVDSKRTSRKRGSENKSLKAAKKSVSKSEIASKNKEDRTISVETSSKISTSQNNELAKGSEELVVKDADTVIPTNVRSRKKSSKKGSENKSMMAVEKILFNSEKTSMNNKDSTTSIECSMDSSKNSPQSKEFSEGLVKDADTLISGNVDSKRSRKRATGRKNIVTTKSDVSDREQASENSDKNHIISIKTSSDNSPFQAKEDSKETEGLLIKDANALSSVNVDSKRTSRKRGTVNKSSVITKNDLVSHSDQTSENNDTERITSVETYSVDLSKNSPLPISAKRTSSKNKTSSTKNTIPSLNQDSFFFVPDSRSDDHSRKILMHASDELDSLNETEESPVDQSENSSVISLNAPKCDDNPQENLNLSGISKKVNTSKKKSVAFKLRKKLNEKDEKQSDSSKISSDNLDVVIENPRLSLKKSSSKKKVASSKLKVVAVSSKEHSDALITKFQASSSYSNVVQEPNNQLLMDSKFNDKSSQKEKISNSKKVKEIHSKKKSNSVESHVSTVNLSQYEVEKVDCDLVLESFMSHKLSKTNKKTCPGSTNKEKSSIESEQIVSPEEATENKHLSENSSEIQMESNSFHSVEKPDICYNSSISENSVDDEKIPGMSMDRPESGKEKHTIIENMAENLEKVDNFAISSGIDFAETDYNSSIEFDEKMRNNYLAFCKVKEVLEASGISIEECFENAEMINSLNSVSPFGVCIIVKCKSNFQNKLFLYENNSKKH